MSYIIAGHDFAASHFFEKTMGNNKLENSNSNFKSQALLALAHAGLTNIPSFYTTAWCLCYQVFPTNYEALKGCLSCHGKTTLLPDILRHQREHDPELVLDKNLLINSDRLKSMSCQILRPFKQRKISPPNPSGSKWPMSNASREQR